MLQGSLLPEAGNDPEVRELLLQYAGPDTSVGKALAAPGGAFADSALWNTPEMWAAEVPAANAVGDARSVARAYAACIGEVDGLRVLAPDQLRTATTQLTEGPDVVLMGLDLQFGLGFLVPSTLLTVGGPHTFGHYGAGGSVGCADPDAELAFGYVMNRMDTGLAGDTRSYDLMSACFDAIR